MFLRLSNQSDVQLYVLPQWVHAWSYNGSNKENLNQYQIQQN